MLKAKWQKIRAIRHDTRGNLLLFVMMFGAVAFTMIVLGVSSYAMFEHQASQRKQYRDLAFHIAEAGINYYRWHLAHSPEDYEDGTGEPGPYVHAFEDKDGVVIGYFSLDITPPLPGTTIVRIRSTGWTVAHPNSTRTVEVRVGYPALTDNSFVLNAPITFSATSEVFGKVHSNAYIIFNGLAHDQLQSAQFISGSGGPQSLWEFPVPPKDFDSISADLASIRDAADDGGLHFYASGAEGYRVVFTPEGGFDLFRVTSRRSYNGFRYDIQNQMYLGHHTIPENGSIFFEDDVWVQGVVNGHVALGAGRFPVNPSNYQEIYLLGNITLLEKESDDVLGLLAQGDIVYPRDTPNQMTVEAALLSQFGKIHRPDYSGNLKQSLTIFGSQISDDAGGVKFVNGWGQVTSGFINTVYIYDGNLRYLTPPGFPVEPTYEIISWEEVES